jgi:hypothetical protein
MLWRHYRRPELLEVQTTQASDRQAAGCVASKAQMPVIEDFKCLTRRMIASWPKRVI